jgi:type II secretory pathway component PulF
MANNLKKTLADQQKLNEAVNAIMENFTNGYPYEEHLEQMVEAQTEIVALMELAKKQAALDGTRCEVDTETIAVFLQAVSTYLKLLKPFALAVKD